MADLEPTPERMEIMRMAANGRLYARNDPERSWFCLGAQTATDDEQRAVLRLRVAGLVGMGNPDAWLKIGNRTTRQMAVTDAGREWLAAHTEEQR